MVVVSESLYTVSLSNIGTNLTQLQSLTACVFRATGFTVPWNVMMEMGGSDDVMAR